MVAKDKIEQSSVLINNIQAFEVKKYIIKNLLYTRNIGGFIIPCVDTYIDTKPIVNLEKLKLLVNVETISQVKTNIIMKLPMDNPFSHLHLRLSWYNLSNLSENSFNLYNNYNNIYKFNDKSQWLDYIKRFKYIYDIHMQEIINKNSIEELRVFNTIYDSNITLNNNYEDLDNTIRHRRGFEDLQITIPENVNELARLNKQELFNYMLDKRNDCILQREYFQKVYWGIIHKDKDFSFYDFKVGVLYKDYIILLNYFIDDINKTLNNIQNLPTKN